MRTHIKHAAVLFLMIGAFSAFAEASPARPRRSGFTPASAPQPEDTDVSKVKERYWGKGDDAELSVVQNRRFSKSGKFEISGFGGFISSDPFLTVRNAGGSVGYHFNEYFALKLLGWKSFVSGSAALKTLESTVTVTANTNEPRSFLGGEAQGSFLYGKLSLLGAAIIYYDLHALGGAGVTNTESGQYFTPYLGLGQQIFIKQWLTLNLDYRAMVYQEQLIEKSGVNPALRGTLIPGPDGIRYSWNNVVTFGVSFLL